MNNWIDVCQVSEIHANIPRYVELDGTRVLVFKRAEEFYAIEDICTHDGGDLRGGCVDGDTIICPRHGARFSIKTGEALSAPAYEPIATFPLRVENSILQLRDSRWD